MRASRHRDRRFHGRWETWVAGCGSPFKIGGGVGRGEGGGFFWRMRARLGGTRKGGPGRLEIRDRQVAWELTSEGGLSGSGEREPLRGRDSAKILQARDILKERERERGRVSE